MAITYNKKTVTKDRMVTPSGPRDRQIKQQFQQQGNADHSVLINELRNQIASLQDRLASSQPGGWTDETVNLEIEKAIREETSRLKEIHKAEVNELSLRANHYFRLANELETKIKLLEKDIEVLNEKVKEKDLTIKELKERKSETDNNVTMLLAEATKKIEALGGSSEAVISPDRPQMETVFVDPIEKESNVEKHFEVEVEDVSISKKEEMGSKVDKLKSLLGKLPNSR